VAEIELERKDGTVRVKIRDYGEKAAAEKAGAERASERAGVGVSGMRERVHGLGGVFKMYDARPGLAVEVELPIAPAATKSA